MISKFNIWIKCIFICSKIFKSFEMKSSNHSDAPHDQLINKIIHVSKIIFEITIDIFLLQLCIYYFFRWFENICWICLEWFSYLLLSYDNLYFSLLDTLYSILFFAIYKMKLLMQIFIKYFI